MAKYYRMIDGVVHSKVEFGGSVVFAMADRTTDGRTQCLLADDVVGKIDDKIITDAVAELKTTVLGEIEK